MAKALGHSGVAGNLEVEAVVAKLYDSDSVARVGKTEIGCLLAD